MPRHRAAFLAATTSLGLSLSAPTLMAQQPTGRLGGDLPTLAANRSVQAELKLTPEQTKQLAALGEKGEEQRQRWLGQMGLATGGGRDRDAPDEPAEPPSFEAMLESRRERQQSAERAIGRILSKAQYARLRQIQLQVEGPAALLRPDLQERLNMSEEQVAQLQELFQERRRAERATRDAANARRKAALDRDATLRQLRERNDPAYRAALAEARRKLDRSPEDRKQVEAFRAEDDRIERQFQAVLHAKVLTRRQSLAYKKMLGAPFDPAASARPTTTPTASPTAAKPRPKPPTLRERRGLGTSDDRP